MKVLTQLLTAEQVKADEMKNYNEREWIKTVDRYLKYDDVQFYKVGKDKIYSYDRFFVVYTLPEGLRLMASMDYSSSLSSGGFAMVDITTIELLNTEDADPNNWVIKHLPEGYVYLIIRKFNSPNGEQVRLNNSPEARKFMIEGSTKYKTIYTKE